MTDVITNGGIDITELVQYYSNLLIIQYNLKPKASATIELMVTELIANGILFDIRDGYNIDTAVGVQLDVLGKYIGVNRNFQDNQLTNMFSLETYGESDPTAEDRWGFVTYANYDTVNENGVLNYQSVLTANFQLNDTDYRTLLKLKIIQNYSNGSHQDIDNAIFEFFGNQVTVEQTAVMQMTYTVPFDLSAVLNAAIVLGILPKPLGVELILDVTNT
jgi:hypothetical protein